MTPPAWPRAQSVLTDAVAARVFPGAIAEVGTSAGALGVITAGTLGYEPASRPVTVDTVYDLASLTKVLCTATCACELAARGALHLDDRVAEWSPSWRGDDRAQVTLRQLLLHASGLPAHRRYFEHLSGGDAIERAIGREALEYSPGSRSVYSDPGFILLGRAIERAGGAPLDAQFDAWWRTALREPQAVQFNPREERRGQIAPTEIDPWRGRLLVGEVHDETAAAMGGVAGHAGLFGTAAGVSACARWWMQHLDRDPWQTFVRRGDVPGSSRALAWDTMLPTSSCGTRMHAEAFGHTGFTGTSLWIDPRADRYVVMLSNRVHPSRAGEAMGRVRPALHDAVWDDLAELGARE